MRSYIPIYHILYGIGYQFSIPTNKEFVPFKAKQLELSLTPNIWILPPSYITN